MANQHARDLLISLEKVLRDYDSPGKLASVIDHTLLSPKARVEEASRIVREAYEYGFYCALVSPYHIIKIRKIASDFGVKLCTVIGFPSGFQPLEAKMAELELVSNIVDEVDVVSNIQALIAGDYDLYLKEISEIVSMAKDAGIENVKVIIEAPLLDDDTLSLAVEAVSKAKADFAKTSTGVYSKGGDPLTVLRVSRLALGGGLKVKAAGGIRTGIDALLALASGAHRIGTSSGPSVIETYKRLT